ncbi:hypothetical protein [Rhizobium sp. Leaf262]|uniref:hypothetical protein n=1 Tax=Rhizobium sp. Leaf262 TaxID=1736312 RepID=UPI0007126BA7|nr:hypothetical protein [Rhizobium sp. Leaf262]KQO80290.1 aminoglycoside phosphotransferase [Rhizobium sp. Leaf262]
MAKSIFRNAFDRVVDARRREADRYVSRALLSLDDTTLAAIGRNREELHRVAKGSYSFW